VTLPLNSAEPIEMGVRVNKPAKKRVRRSFSADCFRYEGVISNAIRALETPTDTPEAREAMVRFTLRLLKGE